MKKLLLLILIILVGAISFLIYAKFLEPNRLVISRAELFLPNWNDDLNGFKIGLISDIHIGTGNIDLKKLDKIVEKMNSQNPDLIILLGDFDAKYIKLSKIPQKDISQSLAKLKAPYGVISILGNHDYNPPEIVKNILQNANIKIFWFLAVGEKEAGDFLKSRKEELIFGDYQRLMIRDQYMRRRILYESGKIVSPEGKPHRRQNRGVSGNYHLHDHGLYPGC